MKLSSVVPWGRSFEEYCEMFALTDRDLNKKILGCADGPSAFNAVLSDRGGHITSIDPIYRFSRQELRVRIAEVYDEIMGKVELEKNLYVWNSIPSVEVLGRVRMEAMQAFLNDYDNGKQEGRYIEGQLPRLALKDKSFNLALCSHFLFLYSEQFSIDDHVVSVLELCRVAREVRIYPLLSLDGRESVHLDPVLEELAGRQISFSRNPVAYEIQKGAREMLVIRQNNRV